MSLVQVELDFVTQLKIGNLLVCSSLNSLKIKCHSARRIQESKAYFFLIVAPCILMHVQFTHQQMHFY